MIEALIMGNKEPRKEIIIEVIEKKLQTKIFFKYDRTDIEG